MQRSFLVKGKKITIKSKPRSHCGNFAGYLVEINGIRYKRACLNRKEAEDNAYVQWVKEEENFESEE